MKIFSTLMVLLFSMTLSAQQLSEYRWKNRLIVLVGSGDAKTMLQDQMAIYEENEDGLDERKLLVYQFTEGTYRLGFCADQEWHIGAVPGFLAKRIEAETSFTFFLIGLDGDVKMQRNESVAIAEIYHLIDRMPMRRAELKRGN